MYITRQHIYLILLTCCFLCLMIAVAEAGSVTKIAKNVVKTSVMNKALGGKMHKPYHRRGFPTWAIVLLVLGGTSVLGLMVFLYCMLRRQHNLFGCFRPTPI